MDINKKIKRAKAEWCSMHLSDVANKLDKQSKAKMNTSKESAQVRGHLL